MTLTFSGKRTCKGRVAYTRLTLHLAKPMAGKRTKVFSPWGDC